MSFLKDVVSDGNAKINQQLSEQLNVQREQISANKLFANDLIEENNDLIEKNKKLEQEILFYKNLLAKPMAEIATVNESFKETYYKQQELLAEWIVSQRAFKEIAIQFGTQLGKAKEEVIEAATANEAKVLNNETEHGNDFNQNDWQIFYAPRVKLRLKIE